MANVAVTFIASLMTMEQEVPVPLHAPAQPEKVEPGTGMAVSVTLVPPVIDALQVEPQLIQLDDEVTVPLPLPSLLTASENEAGMVVDVVVVTYVVVVVGGTVVVAPIPALHGVSHTTNDSRIITEIEFNPRSFFIVYTHMSPLILTNSLLIDRSKESEADGHSEAAPVPANILRVAHVRPAGKTGIQVRPEVGTGCDPKESPLCDEHLRPGNLIREKVRRHARFSQIFENHKPGTFGIVALAVFVFKNGHHSRYARHFVVEKNASAHAFTICHNSPSFPLVVLITIDSRDWCASHTAGDPLPVPAPKSIKFIPIIG
jgi:hypothetical protein